MREKTLQLPSCLLFLSLEIFIWGEASHYVMNTLWRVYMVRNRGLQPTATWVSLEAGPPAKSSLQMTTPWLRSWQQSHERPWARTTQLSCSQISARLDYMYIHIFWAEFWIWKNKQNLGFPCTPTASSETEWDNKFCCFKLLRFGVICYAAVDN